MSTPMFSHQPSSTSGKQCFPLLDAVSFRLTIMVSGLWTDIGSARKGLASCGMVRPSNTREVSVTGPDDLELSGELKVNMAGYDNTQIISMDLNANGMAWLRSSLGMPMVKALDGNLNHIGPHGHGWAKLQQCQLSAFQDAFDELAVQFGKAVPLANVVWAELVLTRSEVCCDVAEGNAIGIAQELATRPAPGLHTSCRFYPKRKFRGHLPTVRWDGGQKEGKIHRKLYAKTPNTLRMEVQCFERSAVDRLLGGKRGSEVPPCDNPVSTLLGRVIGASGTYLKEIAAFRHSLTVRPLSTEDLIAAMDPLSSIIREAGQPSRAGRKLERGTLAAASEAFRSLLLTGRCSPHPGADRKSAHRVALSRMANAPVPVLTKVSSRPLCYTISPAFEVARREIKAWAAMRRTDAAEAGSF